MSEWVPAYPDGHEAPVYSDRSRVGADGMMIPDNVTNCDPAWLAEHPEWDGLPDLPPA